MFLVLVCTMAFIAQHWLGLNVTVRNSVILNDYRDFSRTKLERTERLVRVGPDPTAIRKVVAYGSLRDIKLSLRRTTASPHSMGSQQLMASHGNQ